MHTGNTWSGDASLLSPLGEMYEIEFMRVTDLVVTNINMRLARIAASVFVASAYGWLGQLCGRR